MNKSIFLFFILFIPLLSCAQNISLTHSGTLFDASENPVQKSFQLDLSRKYQITFIPALSASAYFKGEALNPLNSFLFTQKLNDVDFSNVEIGKGNPNKINLNINSYLFNFRIFKTVDYNRELGISLQFRNEGNVNITNETFAILNSYKNFSKSSYQDIFNNSGVNQSYWQLGINYREDYNNTWAFGGKFSLLDGATYNKMQIESSALEVFPNNSFEVALKGNYTSSFGLDSFTYKKILPDLKNLGAAISFGASYTSKKGTYLTFNIKDLGFIHWTKKTSHYNFNDTVRVTNANSVNANASFFRGLNSAINNNLRGEKFNSLIDTKIDFAASKQFGFYTPVIAFSKSVFNENGQLALLNNLRKNAFVFSLNPIYDFRTKLHIGAQMLIQSANAEFYLGSESIFPSTKFVKGYIKKDANSNWDPYSNIYLGLNIKFGRKMQTIGNADEIPGLNDEETGFVVRLSKKDKRAAQKKTKQVKSRRKRNNKRNN